MKWESEKFVHNEECGNWLEISEEQKINGEEFHGKKKWNASVNSKEKNVKFNLFSYERKKWRTK